MHGATGSSQEGCRAARADLNYTDDSEPGITRRRRGRYFSYYVPTGERIANRDEIDRLHGIGMPPAYERCWLNPDPTGHIQATGFDARGRKQYRYHPDFRAEREAGKFSLCPQFGEALPAMRQRVDQALRSRSVSRERTLAALVRLLDVGRVRVGNDAYARENGSFGASTLRMRHVRLEGGAIRLSYRGKSGQMRDMRVRDAGLLRFVRNMQDLPGQRLFQYLDADGQRHEVGSSDVNAFIRETMGAEFSAKHFRTWGGTLVAFEVWLASKGQIGLKPALQLVAEALGNTPAISRKSYVHPAVLAALKAPGETEMPLRLPRARRWLSREERALIEFLRQAAQERR